MTSLLDISKLNTAKELVAAGLRLSIIVSLTGLTARPLRKMWLETHGEGPPNGKLPESVLSFIKNQATAATISAFVAVYLSQYQRQNFKQISPDGLLAVCKAFHQMGTPVNINAAFYGLRDVRAELVSFPKCWSCGAHHIFDTGSSLTSRCPFCGHDPLADQVDNRKQSARDCRSNVGAL